MLVSFDDLVNSIPSPIPRKQRRKKRNGAVYWNVPIAFDIETTSTETEDGEKIAFMWSWSLWVDRDHVIGRTWQEFIDLLDAIHDRLGDVTAIIGVFNLSFEFQFIRKLIRWKSVFSRGSRDVLYATTTNGFEFRDFLAVAGKNLAGVAADLGLRKLVGDLDYTLLRTQDTPMTDKDVEYLTEDVHILAEYIRSLINANGGSIAKIPLTKTGVVRRDLRRKTIQSRDGQTRRDYRQLMRISTCDVDEFALWRDAYAGGFTHANPLWVDRVVDNVRSFDIKSSYPAALVTGLYPHGRGNPVGDLSVDAYKKVISRGYVAVARFSFHRLRRKAGIYMCVLSEHKCAIRGDHLIDNGRVIFADLLTVALCSIDFELIEQLYDFDTCNVHQCYFYERGPLPRALVSGILGFYSAKTTLKGIEDRDVDYRLAKENINSTYGMMVTNPCRTREVYRDSEEFGFSPEEWDEEEFDPVEAVRKMNESNQRFTVYIWGIFCTAYARRRLFDGLLSVGVDTVYSDTDSIKIINYGKHVHTFEKLSEQQRERCRRYAAAQNLPIELFAPIDKKGRQHWIGTWDDEDAHGKRFKTLGAKRYLTFDGERYSITVAGVGKKAGSEWIARQRDPFRAFKDGLYFPPDATGKLCHTYVDEELTARVIDYTGRETTVHSPSGVHLAPTGYLMSTLTDWMDLIRVEQASHTYTT